MTQLKELFQANTAGLTVYSPDCTHSRLWGNLDHAIQEATGLKIGRRQWINHDINSVMRFYQEPDQELPPEQDPREARQKYDNIPIEKLQYGHLVVKLLMMGPSLVTIWHGDDAVSKLLTVKGKTQPAEAAPNTVRGRFWCDNGVCNLMHSSDTTAEAQRELTALNLSHWLDEETTAVAPIAPAATPTTYIPHSGIVIVCDVVNRLLHAQNSPPISITLPPSGNARETNQQLTQQLEQTAVQHPTLSPFIHSFLTGDLIKTTAMLKSMPVTRWEQFVIQCSVIGRDKWHATL